MIVSLDKLTVDIDNFAPKPYQFYSTASAVQSYGLCGLLCTPDKTKRAWEQNAMFEVDYTVVSNIIFDGMYLLGTQAGFYAGYESNKIPLTNPLTITYKRTPTYGTTAYSGICDITFGSNYHGGGITICFAGEVQTKTMCRLTQNANSGQNQIVVDDATGFNVDDYIYIGKHDAVYASAVDATRYRIQSILGNTITLTSNILTNNRLGPHTTVAGDIIPGAPVMKASGYAIKSACDTLTSSAYSNTVLLHGASNVYMSGVHCQGTRHVYGYSTSYKFMDNPENLRTDGWYVCDNFIENYQNAQSGSSIYLMSSIFTQNGGLTFERNMAWASMLHGSYNKHSVVTQIGAVKTGILISRYNVCCRYGGSTALGGSGTQGATRIEEYNELYNCIYGLAIGQTDTKQRYNICYGCVTNNYVYTSVNCITSDNIYDRCTTGILYIANILLKDSVSRNEKFTDISGYQIVLINDMNGEYLYDNCLGNFGNFDSALQSSMLPGTKIRVQKNNQVDNNDFTIQPEGVIYRTGYNLGDTTAHTVGENKFAGKIISTADGNLIAFICIIPTGDIKNRDMAIAVWVMINSEEYWNCEDYQLPRLTLTYDNGVIKYAEAEKNTNFQKLVVPITPNTNYGQVEVSVNGYSTALLDTDRAFYWDDYSPMYPNGYALDLSGIDNWVNGLPVVPPITQIVSDSRTVLDRPISAHSIEGSVGKLLQDINSSVNNIDFTPVNEKLQTVENKIDLIPVNPLLAENYTEPDNTKISDIKTKIDTLNNADFTDTNDKIDKLKLKVNNVEVRVRSMTDA